MRVTQAGENDIVAHTPEWSRANVPTATIVWSLAPGAVDRLAEQKEAMQAYDGACRVLVRIEDNKGKLRLETYLLTCEYGALWS